MAGGPRRGVEWEAAIEGETNSVDRWMQISTSWHPFNRTLVRILATLPPVKRVDLVEDFSRMDLGGG